MIDEYQLIEAKSIGADAVLLIAECLEKMKFEQLAKTCQNHLGLEVLMEMHSIGQLAKLNEHIDIVGVNNRNLENFTVDINNSIGLSEAIPKEFLKISESGINNAESIVELQQAGFQGFLIGEYFMKSPDPPKACADLISSINSLRKMKKLVK